MIAKIIPREVWHRMTSRQRWEVAEMYARRVGGSGRRGIICESWWSWAKRKIGEVMR